MSRTRVPVSDEQRVAIVAGYRREKSVPRVSHAVGLGIRVIERVLRDEGIPIVGRRGRLMPATRRLSTWEPPVDLLKIAWAAGLIDARLRLARSQRNVLSGIIVDIPDSGAAAVLCDVIGLGGSYSMLRGSRWMLSTKNDLLIFLPAIIPYLRIRQALAQRVLDEIKGEEGLDRHPEV